eukprot:TRINITY_DN5525_c0_g1_i1.p1 TRINITY_DN5525_c0_g1~~TRINITY_DN5525_c0_g1_i1.p1  ORF type:complete len:119 (-),score=22.48 TRINITY_DN5525_c0_g1_i1:179-535(-)
MNICDFSLTKDIINSFSPLIRIILLSFKDNFVSNQDLLKVLPFFSMFENERTKSVFSFEKYTFCRYFSVIKIFFIIILVDMTYVLTIVTIFGYFDSLIKKISVMFITTLIILTTYFFY